MTQQSQKVEIDVAELLRGKSVTYVGTLASMTREQFQEVVATYGGRYVRDVGPYSVGILVIGEKQTPLTINGTLPDPLRKVRILKSRMNYGGTVLSEDQFLSLLLLHLHRESLHNLYTIGSLTELLQISRQRIRAWVRAGLIEPAKVEGGTMYFDFRRVADAKLLSDLTRSGVTAARIRRSLELLKECIPDAAVSLHQLSVMERSGALIARLERGDLASPDGQFHLDFDGGADAELEASVPMRIGDALIVPRTAEQWFLQAVEQEQSGDIREAIDSYRQALMLGGPDSDTCFDLAHALASIGNHAEAAERYLQALEISPSFVDAWNNLGICLAAIDKRVEACAAFERALLVQPNDARAHYNLADTLDEMGRSKDARPHWQAYLKLDQGSEWAEYAREQLDGISSYPPAI